MEQPSNLKPQKKSFKLAKNIEIARFKVSVTFYNHFLIAELNPLTKCYLAVNLFFNGLQRKFVPLKLRR